MENEKKSLEFRKEYNREDSGLAFLLVNIIPLLCMFMLTFILSASNVDLTKVSDQLWFLIISALLSQLSFIATMFFVNKSNKVKYSALKFSFKLGYKNILLCILIGVICYFGLYNFIGQFDILFEKLGYVYTGSSLPLTNGWELVLNIVLLGIIPPICEEIVFRGIILNGLRKKHSDVWAVVITGALFALMHGSLTQLVYPFLMGMLFSILVLRTGNLLSCIIVHMTNNIVVIVFSYIQNLTGFSIGISLGGWEILISIVIALAAFVVLYLIDKFYFKHKNSEVMQIEREHDNKKNYFMIIGVVLAGLIFIVNTISSF